MKWQIRLSTVALALLFVITALPGCGIPKVKITGKLMKNGQPYTVAKDTMVTLIFFPDGENQQQTYNARFKQEVGTYEIELPAGKYRTSFVIMEKGKDLLTAPAEFKNKSYDLNKNQELDIEIAGK